LPHQILTLCFVGGLLEQTETARTITRLKEIDPNFELEAFLKEARELILPEVIEAWLLSDKITLAEWCSEASVKVITSGQDELVKQNLFSDSKLLELNQVELRDAKLMDNGVPVLLISFATQEILLYRDRTTKEVRLGKEDAILNCRYVTVFTLDEEAKLNNPVTRGWKLVEQAKHSSGSGL
jgi:import inner membrane translocase subunit TIM44